MYSNLNVEMTALSWAVSTNNYESVNVLLGVQDINVDIQNGLGMTPLMDASRDNQLEIAKLIIKYGADIGIQDATGKTYNIL